MGTTLVIDHFQFVMKIRPATSECVWSEPSYFISVMHDLFWFCLAPVWSAVISKSYCYSYSKRSNNNNNKKWKKKKKKRESIQRLHRHENPWWYLGKNMCQPRDHGQISLLILSESKRIVNFLNSWKLSRFYDDFKENKS